MLFPTPLIPARLQRRYKRFLADVILPDGSAALAHCPNPGSMLGLAEPETLCWLSDHRGTARKLPYGWEVSEVGNPATQVQAGRHFVGINTGLANAIVAEALAAGRIPALTGYDEIRREVRVGTQSRLDFLLLRRAGTPEAPTQDDKRRACYVEVKSVTLSRAAGLAEFPDARTARGARHLAELAELAAAGHRAMLLFLVQRDDCTRVRCAADIDPFYAAALRQVAGSVEIRAYGCDFAQADGRPLGITLSGEIPVDLA
jgi:sugar fermentation stimulation protein A